MPGRARLLPAGHDRSAQRMGGHVFRNTTRHLGHVDGDTPRLIARKFMA